MALKDASAYTRNGTVDINMVLKDMVQRSPWYYYDTLQLSAAQGSAYYDLFSTPMSSTKSKLYTNMQRGNQFPTSKGLVMDQLGVFNWGSVTKADLDRLIENYYLEFRIDDKIQLEGQLTMFPSGLGVFGNGNVASTSCFNNGLPGFNLSRKLGDYCMYIAPLQEFSLKLVCGVSTPPTFVAASNFTFVLGGLTDRSVQ